MPKAKSKASTIDPDNLPPPAKSGPKAIPIELMIDLKRRGLADTQIGELLGCHGSNVGRRLAKLSSSIDITDKYIKHRPWLFAYEQQRIRQSITQADIRKAGLRDKIVAIGILHDHELKAAGLPTQIILYADGVKMRQQLIEERKALEAEAVMMVDSQAEAITDI